MAQVLRGNTQRPPLWWAKLVAQHHELLPQFPGVELIHPARIPEPPYVRSITAVGVENVILWYLSTMHHVYGYSRRTKTLESAVRAALPLLIDMRVPPASWVMFSIDVWLKYAVGGEGDGAWNSIPSKRRTAPKRMPPPPRWIFSPKRLQNRADWFRWHEGFYRGGRLFISKPHRQLLRRYARMREALEQLETVDEDMVRAVVNRWLPRKLYASLVEEARVEAEFKQSQLVKLVRKGTWLW